jgi:hypothetical protein
VPGHYFFDRWLLKRRPLPTYEVLSKGVTTGPWLFGQILHRLREKQFTVDDLCRHRAWKEWKSLKSILRRGKHSVSLLFAVEAVLIAVFGLFLMWHGLKIVNLAKESSTWPCVPGKITESGIEPLGNGQGLIPSFVPRVEYLYQIGSRPFFGSNIRLGGSVGRESWARAVSSHYPVGSSCSVFYQPRKPQQAVLEPGVRADTFRVSLIGLVLFYSGTMLGLHACKVWKQEIPPPLIPLRVLLKKLAITLMPAIVGFSFAFWFL